MSGYLLVRVGRRRRRTLATGTRSAFGASTAGFFFDHDPVTAVVGPQSEASVGRLSSRALRCPVKENVAALQPRRLGYFFYSTTRHDFGMEDPDSRLLVGLLHTRPLLLDPRAAGARRSPRTTTRNSVSPVRRNQASFSWFSTASMRTESDEDDDNNNSPKRMQWLDPAMEANDELWLVHGCRNDDGKAVQHFVDRLKAAADWNDPTTAVSTTDADDNDEVDNNLAPLSPSACWDVELCRTLTKQYDAYLRAAEANPRLCHPQLLQSDAVVRALKVLTKTRPASRNDMALRLRSWERILGSLRQTELTDHLSLRLLTVNAKAGQVGRVLALLKLRADKRYEPRSREFPLAIRAVRIAQRHHRERNLFVSDSDAFLSWSGNPATTTMPSSSSSSALSVPVSAAPPSIASATPTAPTSMLLPLDNPTRWLDAILLNMKARNVPLTPSLASQMLWCYSSGYTGKATHHFYRVKRRPVGPADPASTNGDSDGMPVQTLWDRHERKYVPSVTKVHIEYNTCTPPFYKVPSLVGRQALQYRSHQTNKSHASSSRLQLQSHAESASSVGPAGSVGRTKLEMEQDPSYSPALNAAFEFASSLELGAAGHDPIELNHGCVNALVSSCVSRGALWRARKLVEDNKNASSSSSSTNRSVSIATYNLLLVGLARVGDVQTMQEVTGQLLGAGHRPNSGTVRAIVTGLLNLGDVSSAITVVQDSFNQHSVLPPVSTLLTILEHCLARDVAFEAKRCLYFIQQLWKFEPNPYHTPAFVAFMRRIQNHPQLQRPAMEHLFSYFGHDLHESDFF